MITKTRKFFNQATRQSLLDQVGGYVDKSHSINLEIDELKKKYNINKVYRFDLGENVDGFSPLINYFLEELYKNKSIFSRLNEYPDITHRNLRKRLASLYNINREDIVISTGLDSILDLITRVFFDYNNVYLMPIPDFFLFENYSERMGATPMFLPLKEVSKFTWTTDTMWEFNDLIIKFKPKIVWLSNPSNPTGQYIESRIMEEIIKLTYSHNVFIVIDEAYGEYIGNPEDSAVKHIKKYNNLMVLRTLSKAYGLAGIRIGYLMCSSKEIIKALLMHRHHFPATQMGLNLAHIAVDDQEFIQVTRNNIKWRGIKLFKNLDTLKTFQYIKSQTNIFMLKNNYLSDIEFRDKLKPHGILASSINISDVKKRQYLRFTIRTDEDNEYLFKILTKIDNEMILNKSLTTDTLN